MSGSQTFANPNVPSMADYLVFIRLFMGISPAILPDDSLAITASYNVAIAKVNDALNCANPFIYTLAVYNYAADRLVNYAMDQPGMCYFQDLRKQLGVNNGQAGMIQASADQGTSQSWMLPDWVKNMSLTNTQMLKTPWGQTYLGFAQEYGTNLWGLT